MSSSSLRSRGGESSGLDVDTLIAMFIFMILVGVIIEATVLVHRDDIQRELQEHCPPDPDVDLPGDYAPLDRDAEGFLLPDDDTSPPEVL